jgi:4-hydroxy-2-oxoheptanedioate aldolase
MEIQTADMAVSVGGWSSIGHPAMLAVLASAGFDWVCLDTQHGSYDEGAVLAALRGGTPAEVDVLVRVRANDHALIGRALDMGADGVIVPMVNSVAEAAAAVSSCRYPPLGQRSWGPMVAQWGGSIDPPERANGRVICAVMVETAEAIAQVPAIAAVTGVDMVFVGPFDLALALGASVDELLADDSTSSPLGQVVAACAEAGVLAGAFAGTVQRGQRLATLGFSAIAVATDLGLLTGAAAAALTTSRPSRPSRRLTRPPSPPSSA